MPRYDYKCKECHKDFFIVTGMNDSRKEVLCSNCQSKDTVRVFNAVVLKGNSFKEKENKITNNKNDLSNNDSINKNDDHQHKYGEQCSPEEDYI